MEILARKILERQGVSYIEWLEQQYMNLVRDNSEFLAKSLDGIPAKSQGQ